MQNAINQIHVHEKSGTTTFDGHDIAALRLLLWLATGKKLAIDPARCPLW